MKRKEIKKKEKKVSDGQPSRKKQVEIKSLPSSVKCLVDRFRSSGLTNYGSHDVGSLKAFLSCVYQINKSSDKTR